MNEFLTSAVRPMGRACRSVAIGLIGGVWRRMSHEEIDARLARRPAVEQTMIVAAALVGLATASLLSAQFGVAGLLAFFLAVVALVR